MNKKLALSRLKDLIEEKNNQKKEVFEKKSWTEHNKLVRGNEKKVFKDNF